MFGKYELRYLADPKGALGAAEEVLALGRQGLREASPKVAGFLSRLNMPLDELESAMLMAQEKSYDEAVAAYIENNDERVDSWVEVA